MHRVIVCGSRDWSNRDKLFARLDRLHALYPRDLLIVHGDCPTGADYMAEQWCALRGVAVERHPPDWKLGKKAGPLRSLEMAKLGALLCIAFLDASKCIGTKRAIRFCRNESIRVDEVHE